MKSVFRRSILPHWNSTLISTGRICHNTPTFPPGMGRQTHSEIRLPLSAGMVAWKRPNSGKPGDQEKAEDDADRMSAEWSSLRTD